MAADESGLQRTGVRRAPGRLATRASMAETQPVKQGSGASGHETAGTEIATSSILWSLPGFSLVRALRTVSGSDTMA